MEPRQPRLGILQVHAADAVTFARVDKGLGRAVALGALSLPTRANGADARRWKRRSG
jgi:hypothetical protein